MKAIADYVTNDLLELVGVTPRAAQVSQPFLKFKKAVDVVR
jgi:hypothetical protein